MNRLLIKTKLAIPQNREQAIARPTLVKKLNEGLRLGRRMTLVSAPPGYGKTSLAVEWVRDAKTGCAWYGADHADNDPIRFFSYLTEALRNVDNSIGEAALSLLDSPQTPPGEMLMGTLINDLSDTDRRVILVFDDFQHIRNPSILEALDYFVDNSPVNLHIALISREDPRISLSRLRSRGDVTEIRESDLRFSLQEATGFFKETLNLDLSERQIQTLQEKTEGWAAGLQLAAFSIRGMEESELASFLDDFSGTQRYVIDYLFDEVIAKLPENIRLFLVKTSIFERFSAALCDAVLEETGSKTIINTILKANMFIIQLDSQGEWYRYHTLFRDMLRGELCDAGIRELHGKAVGWLEANGLTEEAVRHAIASGRHDHLERLLLSCGRSLIQKGELATLSNWIDLLPGDRLLQNPLLGLYKAWCLLFTGKGREAAELFGAIGLEELVRKNPDLRGDLMILQIYGSINIREISRLKLIEQAETLIGSANAETRAASLYCAAQMHALTDRLEESLQSYRLAYELAFQNRLNFLSLLALKNLAISLLLRGKKRETVAVCLEAEKRFSDARGRLLPIAALLYIPLGMAYYAEDSLRQAEDCLKKGITTCQKLGLLHFSVQGLMTTAFLKEAEREPDTAVNTIEQAILTLRQIGLEAGIPLFRAVEAELKIKSGDAASGRRWAEESGILVVSGTSFRDTRQLLVLVRLLIAEKDYRGAETLLAGMERSLSKGGGTYWLITVYILMAIVYFRTNNIGASAESLSKAVEFASPESLYRLFLDEGDIVLDILGKVRTDPVFIDNLRRKYGRDPIPERPGKVADPTGNPADPLSEREMEVLKLVSEGRTNQEIADMLFISLGTTKWHITNIFSKLGVKNRVQAVEIFKTML